MSIERISAGGEIFDLVKSGEHFASCDLHEVFSRWCGHCLDLNDLSDPHDRRLPYLVRVADEGTAK